MLRIRPIAALMTLLSAPYRKKKVSSSNFWGLRFSFRERTWTSQCCAELNTDFGTRRVSGASERSRTSVMTLMARIRFFETSSCQKLSTEWVGQICFPPRVGCELCAVACSRGGIAVAFLGLPCSAEFGFASTIHEIGAGFTKYMKLVWIYKYILVKVMNDESCALRCQEEDALRPFSGINETWVGTFVCSSLPASHTAASVAAAVFAE